MKYLIITKYCGPANCKGARIRVHSIKGTTWHGFDYAAHCPHESAAREHATKHGLSSPESVLSGIETGRAFIA